jgi:hypothetical protein
MSNALLIIDACRTPRSSTHRAEVFYCAEPAVTLTLMPVSWA